MQWGQKRSRRGPPLASFNRPDGSRLWQALPQVVGDNRGGPVDSAGHIWFVHLGASRLSKFDGSTGAHLGHIACGLSPYTYSDVTGLGLRSSFPKGTWNVVFASHTVLP